MPFTPIIIKAIPAIHQRYETVGDWLEPAAEGYVAEIRVSDTGINDYTFLLALHELVEYYLCSRAGITQTEVDSFDKHWEATHNAVKDGEPGNDPAAPYHMQHEFAGLLERLLANHMGVNWETYEQAVNKAYDKTKRHLQRERRKNAVSELPPR